MKERPASGDRVSDTFLFNLLFYFFFTSFPEAIFRLS